MLYHWHELDLESAPPICAAQHRFAHVDAPRIRYNAATAIAHASGTPFRFDVGAPILIPANDQKIDAIAARLRKNGLGLIGEPRQRAEPGDYSLLQQTSRRCRSAICFMATFAIDTFNLFARKRGQYFLAPSHTMVSNGADDQSTTRDDAQRQRFNASIG